MDKPGIVLSAHTDVVPAEEPDWSSDPFSMDVRAGRAYGRGSSDMKGFLAAVLAHVSHWCRAPLVHPVHLAFSYDEEVGCLGAPDLAARLAELVPRPGLCIVGEPTGMRVATAHKGKIAKRVVVRGRSGHSAMPHRAANAVECCVQILGQLIDLGRSFQDGGPHDKRFDPSWSTLHVGAIHGGSALNIVPESCEFLFEIRNLPGHQVSGDLEAVRARAEHFVDDMRRRAPESSVEWQEILRYPPLIPPDDKHLVDFVLSLTGTTEPPMTVSFGTEAGIFAEVGIPTVVCGPGDIGRAHRADEYIELTELEACDAFLARLTKAMCAPLPM